MAIYKSYAEVIEASTNGKKVELWKDSLAGIFMSGAVIDVELPHEIYDCDFIRCTFLGSKIETMTGGSIQGSTFKNCRPSKLLSVNSRQVVFSGYSWYNITYATCDLRRATFSDGDLYGEIIGCDLTGVVFMGCDIKDLTISGCKTSGMVMRGCKIEKLQIMSSDVGEEDIMNMLSTNKNEGWESGLVNKYTLAHS